MSNSGVSAIGAIVGGMSTVAAKLNDWSAEYAPLITLCLGLGSIALGALALWQRRIESQRNHEQRVRDRRLEHLRMAHEKQLAELNRRANDDDAAD